MIVPSRRSFITGLVASLVAAPAVVRAASLMPVRALAPIQFEGIDIVFDGGFPYSQWQGTVVAACAGGLEIIQDVDLHKSIWSTLFN